MTTSERFNLKRRFFSLLASLAFHVLAVHEVKLFQGERELVNETVVEVELQPLLATM